jgi:pimeloyl-ACP methyl ester carboxylesterase
MFRAKPPAGTRRRRCHVDHRVAGAAHNGPTEPNPERSMTLLDSRRGFPTYRDPATPAGSIYHEATRRYHGQVNDPVTFRAALAGRRLRPYTIDLARISVPALVYVGSEDQPELSRRTAVALGVELLEIPGLDHRTGLTATDAVMALVAPFLATSR